MDINSLSASTLQMDRNQNQQALSTSMIKLNMHQQNQMADMLAQNVLQLAKSTPQTDSRYQFSVFA